jgi:hypothetical protein
LLGVGVVGAIGRRAVHSRQGGAGKRVSECMQYAGPSGNCV